MKKNSITALPSAAGTLKQLQLKARTQKDYEFYLLIFLFHLPLRSI